MTKKRSNYPFHRQPPRSAASCASRFQRFVHYIFNGKKKRAAAVVACFCALLLIFIYKSVNAILEWREERHLRAHVVSTYAPPGRLEQKVVQRGSWEALLQFDAMCKQHSVQYVVVGGTLLGAYRDRKLIPWDVDQDVLMEEAEFHRLAKLGGRMQGAARLSVSSPDANIAARMTDTRTGGYVDIFVIKESMVDKNGIVATLFSFPPFKRSLVFPTNQTIILEGRSFSAPMHTKAFLNSQYISLEPSSQAWIIGQFWLTSGLGETFRGLPAFIIIPACACACAFVCKRKKGEALANPIL